MGKDTTPIAPESDTNNQITDTEIILETRPPSLREASTTMSSSEEQREIVRQEVSELEETIMKTIENAKEFEDVIPREEVETRPHYNFDANNFNSNEKLEEEENSEKTEFDDIIEEKELRPIVKSILENKNEEKNDQERDYIVEDVSTGLFTEQALPSSPNLVWNSEIITSTSTTSAPVTTFDTIPTTTTSYVSTEQGQYERVTTTTTTQVVTESSNNDPDKVRISRMMIHVRNH